MKKKFYIIILILSLLLLFGGLVFYNNYLAHQQINIGGVYFDLPQGFQVSGTNDIGDIMISNGTTSIFIAYYDNPNIQYFMDQYKNDKNKLNESLSISSVTFNDVKVYKSDIIDGKKGSNHYWFNSNNNTYSIYTWEETPNVDQITREIINSASLSNQ